MVVDAIKASSFYKMLCLSRSIVKFLRTHKFQYEARDAGIRYYTLIFSTTRWDGDFLMVIMKSIKAKIFLTNEFFVPFQLQSQLKCEDAINHFAQKDLKFIVIKQFLPDICETVKILEEPYAVTKMYLLCRTSLVHSSS